MKIDNIIKINDETHSLAIDSIYSYWQQTECINR